jgi:hypothetical protein
MKKELSLSLTKALLPKVLRMVYGLNDVLASPLEVGEECEVQCDDDTSRPKYVAEYRLVKIVKRA